MFFNEVGNHHPAPFNQAAGDKLVGEVMGMFVVMPLVATLFAICAYKLIQECKKYCSSDTSADTALDAGSQATTNYGTSFV